MAVRLADLNVQLTGSPISLLREENAAFLRGEGTEPSLGNLWAGWATVGTITIIGGVLIFIIVGVLLLSEWIWGSPFVSEVNGTIDKLDGSIISYHYEVDGSRYDNHETTRVYSSSYEEGGLPSPVVYLRFSPSQSKLRFNVEAPSLLMVIAALIFIASLPLAGYFVLRAYRRMTRIRDEATHLIEGTIHLAVAGNRGTVNYGYKATSPVTGKMIGGLISVGRLSPHFGRFQKGSTVAILYRDDKNLAAL